MKIGDEVYIHGYVDEIRKDTVIIRNDGGYFGTVKEEIKTENTSVNTEQKRGQWITKEGKYADLYECNNCGILSTQYTRFCPQCGYRMLEDSDEK